MMISELLAERFYLLLDWNVLTEDEFRSAKDAAASRGLELEKVLLHEYRVPRHILLKALSGYYKCPFIEYDERLPVPPDLLEGLDAERLSTVLWFPVIRDGDVIVIAASNPYDPELAEEVKKYTGTERYEFLVALEEDIQWFIKDFVHAKPGLLIGTERTGLAFWRNTMAHWRTRLACYRNDLAIARTDLAWFRLGLGFIALANALIRSEKSGPVFYWSLLTSGTFLSMLGFSGYMKIRKSRITPPGPQTLVEVTSATVSFLEDYHFIEGADKYLPTKQTMLARLGDFLANHSTILAPSPASKERTQLARERNVLAGQRTVAGCYRTIYSRARTGLAFIRTGVSFMSLGLGLIQYFGLSLLTVFDVALVVAGALMMADGLLWYMPVRKEQAELPRSPVPQ